MSSQLSEESNRLKPRSSEATFLLKSLCCKTSTRTLPTVCNSRKTRSLTEKSFRSIHQLGQHVMYEMPGMSNFTKTSTHHILTQSCAMSLTFCVKSVFCLYFAKKGNFCQDYIKLTAFFQRFWKHRAQVAILCTGTSYALAIVSLFGFSQTYKIGNIAIIVNFLSTYPNIFSVFFIIGNIWCK